MVYVLNPLLSTFNTAMNQFLYVAWPKCAVKNVHKYISSKLCFTPEKISKYTEIGDFIGVGQTSIQIPGWDINYDFILAKVLLVLWLINNFLINNNSFKDNNNNNLIYETFCDISNKKKRKIINKLGFSFFPF